MSTFVRKRGVEGRPWVVFTNIRGKGLGLRLLKTRDLQLLSQKHPLTTCGTNDSDFLHTILEFFLGLVSLNGLCV